MTEEIKEVPAQEAQAAAPEAPVADLTIADLNALRAIVDVACQRGAFKAPEMEAVGKTFNKLNAFLEAAAKNAQPAQGQE
jgi:hypothetical protein